MNMREKIARAMHAKRGGYLAWDNLPLLEQSLYLEAADAALAALEEPTEAMLRAENDFVPTGTQADLFRAMIRAAREG